MVKNKDRYKNVVVEYGEKELFDEYDCKFLAEVIDTHIGDIPKWFRDIHSLSSHELKNNIFNVQNQ